MGRAEGQATWYRLDTSAKIYPALESPEDTTVFRVSMTLKDEIDPEILAQALAEAKVRFPYYNVHLKRGIFWNYLERNDNESVVWPDTPCPCERLHARYNNGYLYKVKCYKRRIAVEFSHVLTDGVGGLEFLKTLVHRYLVLTGKVSESSLAGILNVSEAPGPEESEDAFLRVLEIEKDALKGKERTLFGDDRAFKIRDRALPLGNHLVVTGIVSVEELKVIAGQYCATVTELLVSLIMEALILAQAEQVRNKNKHRNIAVEIPVNMRRFYPIRCMRNFSLFVIPTIDPREVESFEEIVAQVKTFVKEHATRERLLLMVRDNTALGGNWLLKHIPLFVKNSAIRYVSRTKGSTQFSGTLSNLGVVRLPEELAEYVQSMNLILCPPVDGRTMCAVLGYRGNVAISFGRIVRDARIARHVFGRLVEMGASVEVRSN
ncbi:MAG: hypothetical protein MUQ10_06205 [Anaerolineae bacterium]|nr:hypothetical protein [Anaerolineae bacterium]